MRDGNGCEENKCLRSINGFLRKLTAFLTDDGSPDATYGEKSISHWEQHLQHAISSVLDDLQEDKSNNLNDHTPIQALMNGIGSINWIEVAVLRRTEDLIGIIPNVSDPSISILPDYLVVVCDIFKGLTVSLSPSTQATTIPLLCEILLEIISQFHFPTFSRFNLMSMQYKERQRFSINNIKRLEGLACCLNTLEMLLVIYNTTTIEPSTFSNENCTSLWTRCDQFIVRQMDVVVESIQRLIPFRTVLLMTIIDLFGKYRSSQHTQHSGNRVDIDNYSHIVKMMLITFQHLSERSLVSQDDVVWTLAIPGVEFEFANNSTSYGLVQLEFPSNFKKGVAFWNETVLNVQANSINHNCTEEKLQNNLVATSSRYEVYRTCTGNKQLESSRASYNQWKSFITDRFYNWNTIILSSTPPLRPEHWFIDMSLDWFANMMAQLSLPRATTSRLVPEENTALCHYPIAQAMVEICFCWIDHLVQSIEFNFSSRHAKQMTLSEILSLLCDNIVISNTPGASVFHDTLANRRGQDGLIEKRKQSRSLREFLFGSRSQFVVITRLFLLSCQHLPTTTANQLTLSVPRVVENVLNSIITVLKESVRSFKILPRGWCMQASLQLIVVSILTAHGTSWLWYEGGRNSPQSYFRIRVMSLYLDLLEQSLALYKIDVHNGENIQSTMIDLATFNVNLAIYVLLHRYQTITLIRESSIQSTLLDEYTKGIHTGDKNSYEPREKNYKKKKKDKKNKRKRHSDHALTETEQDIFSCDCVPRDTGDDSNASSVSLCKRISGLVQRVDDFKSLCHSLLFSQLIPFLIYIVPLIGLDLNVDVLKNHTDLDVAECRCIIMQHYEWYSSLCRKENTPALPILLCSNVFPSWASIHSEQNRVIVPVNNTTTSIVMNFELWPVSMSIPWNSSSTKHAQPTSDIPDLHTLRPIDIITLFNHFIEPHFEIPTEPSRHTTSVHLISSVNKIDVLPQEVLLLIFSYSNYKRVCRVATVCKSFATVISTNMTLWQILYHRSFPRALFAEEILATEQVENAIEREQGRLRRVIRRSFQEEALGHTSQKALNEMLDIKVEKEVERVIRSKVCLFCSDYIDLSSQRLCLKRLGCFHNYLKLFKVLSSLICIQSH